MQETIGRTHLLKYLPSAAIQLCQFAQPRCNGGPGLQPGERPPGVRPTDISGELYSGLANACSFLPHVRGPDRFREDEPLGNTPTRLFNRGQNAANRLKAHQH